MAAAAAAEADVSPTTVLQQGQLATPPLTMASIYIGDLDPAISDDALSEVFKPFGTVLSVRVCRDIITRRSLGYGYVNFQHRAEAEEAIRQLNYKAIGNRCVRLMWQQRDPSQRYSGNGNVFVKGFGDTVDNKTLHEIFNTFGTVLSAKVMTDEQAKSRGLRT